MNTVFDGSTLLITGGTGTFGNAVARRMLRSDVAEIRIFSRDEKKQHDMRIEYHEPRLKFYIGDVRDPDSLRDALEGVDYVFHAAALKQIPSCEFYPLQALMTNCLGRRERHERRAVGGRAAHDRPLHRQGRLSDQRDGHLQGDDGAPGGSQEPRRRVAGADDLHHALRQRDGQPRLGDPAVRRADPLRRSRSP